MTNSISTRIGSNKHVAGDLRRRLEARHAASTAIRETLDQLSDNELIETFLKHEQQGRDHVKQRAEKDGGIE